MALGNIYANFGDRDYRHHHIAINFRPRFNHRNNPRWSECFRNNNHHQHSPIRFGAGDACRWLYNRFPHIGRPHLAEFAGRRNAYIAYGRGGACRWHYARYFRIGCRHHSAFRATSGRAADRSAAARFAVKFLFERVLWGGREFRFLYGLPLQQWTAGILYRFGAVFYGGVNQHHSLVRHRYLAVGRGAGVLNRGVKCLSFFTAG